VIELTLREIADAVGGRVHNASGDEKITGSVEFDSRKIGPGGLFVAFPGERVDGHDFAKTAIDQGAVGVLAAREIDAPAVICPPVPGGPSSAYVLAGDTDGSGAAVLAALAALARAVVDRLPDLKIVGVTGSSGKTSTKDLIAQVLAPMGATVAPPGSFNNELGHPWTVLRADRDTKHLVLELSARGPGHIAHLCEVAPRTSASCSTSGALTSASSAPARASRRPRASWSRRWTRTASRCSTPTIRWSRAWRAAQRPGSCWSARPRRRSSGPPTSSWTSRPGPASRSTACR